MKVLQCNWKVFLCILKYKNGTKRETKRIKTRRSQKEKQKDKREKKKKKKKRKEKKRKSFLLFKHIQHPTFHIPHSMLSLVAWSIAEPKYLLGLLGFGVEAFDF
jgi:predicted ATP-dependent protease